MEDQDRDNDELQRRRLQEYIFSLEEFQEKAETLALEHDRLRHTQDLLVSILGAATHGICLIKGNEIVWCNQGLTDISGYGHEELVGNTLAAMFDEEKDFLRISERIKNDLSNTGTMNFDFGITHRDGRKIPCIFTGRPLNERDPASGYIVSLTDITSRKKAEEELESRVQQRTEQLVRINKKLVEELSRRRTIEEALRASEELYRTLFESANDAIFLMKGAKLVDCNTRAVDMFGYDKSFLLNSTPILLSPESEPDRAGQTRARIERALRGEPQYYEWRYQRADGSVFETEVNLTRIELVDGYYVQAIIRDMTARKQAEEDLTKSRDLFHSIFQYHPYPLLFCLRDEGTIKAVNSSFERTWGYREGEIIGQSARMLYANAEHRDEMLKKLGEGSRVLEFETVGVKGDGTMAPCLLSVEPVEVQGRPHIIVTAVDVTERRYLEEQLRQAQKMEAVGTLASGIAHDFNNILQAISGYLQLMLAKDGLNQEHGKYLSEADRAVERASDLVQRLLTFSHKAEPELRPIDLNREVEHTVRILERTIPKMVAIETILAPSLKLIKADPTQLERILMNLGTNARDAMPEGGRLVIQTKNVTLDKTSHKISSEIESGDYVALLVTDTGPGMDAVTAERIFEPFFTTKGVGEGTGLGMFTVYRIVKGHNGYITCLSEPGRGTSFHIFFPAVELQELVSAAAERKVEVVNLRGCETILLVDDEKAVLDIAREILEDNGYAVIQAGSGEEAVRIFQEDKRPDLVILDIGMPGMGGLSCLKELLILDPTVRVIIASGYSADSQEQEAFSRGARGFIGKPYRLERLLREVRRVLDGEGENQPG